MPPRQITDWDDAYLNSGHIVGGAEYPARWEAQAKAFRDGLGRRAVLDLDYGRGARQRYDLFRPESAARGLMVFVHGGYWMRFDKSLWSHLASGPLAHGYAVAMLSYTLCPAVRIADIVREVGDAINLIVSQGDGPVVLAGHSAGGHLVTRMICADTPLDPAVSRRIVHVLSISGVHDLRPLMRTTTNDTLHLDDMEAKAESPALLRPIEGARVTCWVGAAERGEFVRQNALLANIWTGLGARTQAVEEPDRHHFNVVEGLADPNHPMVRAALDG